MWTITDTPIRFEYETSCACGFTGKGNGTKPPKCPACGRDW